MAPIEHFNAFCTLFQSLQAICASGPDRKCGEDAKGVRMKMKAHYHFFDDKMIKYMDKFSRQLLLLGWDFNEQVTVNVADVDNLPEVKPKGEFKYAKHIKANAALIVDNVYNDEDVFAVDKYNLPSDNKMAEKDGRIYNYNEFSKPLTELDPKEQDRIIFETLQNFHYQKEMIETGQRPKANRQPKRWGLSDAERTW